MLAAATALIASTGAVAVPGGPAQAQTDCVVVDVQTTTFPSGDGGFFLLSIDLTNLCPQPLTAWTVELELPAGAQWTSGWSADWSQSGQVVTATAPAWAPPIAYGQSYSFGALGTYSGEFIEPLSCSVNGSPCDGAAPPSPPPGGLQVTLTAPADGSSVLYPCPVTLTADATAAPGGEVDRVEFYVDGNLVGTQTDAPYEVEVRSLSGASHTAFARVYDTEDPPNSADSDLVRFTLAPPPPALMIIACSPNLEIPAGGDATVEFFLSANAQVPVDLTVTGAGAADVSVDPDSFLLDGAVGQQVVVRAAPGAAPASATITATAPQFLPTRVTVQVTNP